MRESDIKPVFDKIQPSSALLEKTKASVRSVAGEEQSFRFNFRWFIPKMAVAAFAVCVIFAAIFVLNRAPAIYENELTFENRGQFAQVDRSTLPSSVSVSPRTLGTEEELKLMVVDDGKVEQLQALITCEILEKEMYLAKSEDWYVCVYYVRPTDVLEVMYTLDVLSGTDKIPVVTYVETVSELAALPDVGEDVTMLLRKSEDGSPINEYGQKAGITGAWELYGIAPVENDN